jgi:hypothetical protein
MELRGIAGGRARASRRRIGIRRQTQQDTKETATEQPLSLSESRSRGARAARASAEAQWLSDQGKLPQ